jgi:hypothetical protein
MQNPWKLSTLVLGGTLLISNARAETDWRQDALGHLESAAKILRERGGGTNTGKTPGDERPPEKKGADASPASKALQLTRAAIVQLKRAGAE